jgi:hypothetical protein
MVKYSNFLPALALAAALTPFAASARVDRFPVPNPAHQQSLTTTFDVAPPAAEVRGR